MEKSPDAFRTISEVAEELDLPQHVLRFWETRFSQIKPMKRGGGRRYYRPNDVDMLRGIKHLLYEEGYTIKGVQKLLRENGVQFAVAIGTGDMSAFEEMTRKNADAARVVEEEQKRERHPIAADGDSNMLVGEPRVRGKGIFGLGGKADADGQDGNKFQLSQENRALLQEALFDLLECKRLLDQSR
ncbi:MerR family transcriptional regulator [Oricola indica]|jgi:DNA-binding transcriptional MerR regulator|uniref:MerR family transcriptional regulator n=1 Tax=Oricola indica TaxID=2872591 RepID=UPI001CBAE8CB|nr:MerR family transcriptional regulator [Oricola indica]